MDSYPGVFSSSIARLVERAPAGKELDFSSMLWDKNDFIASIREKRETMEPIETGHRAVTIS